MKMPAYVSKIRFEPLVIIASLLISGTYILDRVVLVFLRIYLRNHYDSHFVAKNQTEPDQAVIMYWALFITSFYLIVYHLLVLVAVILVYFKPKLKIYKRELLFAYVIILVCYIAYFAINRFLISH
jgi:hypothetical protein